MGLLPGDSKPYLYWAYEDSMALVLDDPSGSIRTGVEVL